MTTITLYSGGAAIKTYHNATNIEVAVGATRVIFTADGKEISFSGAFLIETTK